jgi:hypothetical protein
MARGVKPVAERAAAVVPGGRPAIWRALLAHARTEAVTTGALERACYVPKRTIASYLRALMAAGHVVALPPAGPRAGVRYQLAGAPPIAPPRLRPDGTRPTQGGGRDRMWRTAKMLKVFTARDLAIAASIEGGVIAEAEAETYLRFLARADYLRIAKPAARGRGGAKAVYRFARSTGPEAPQVTRLKAVWDPNLCRITWHAGEPG